jgi:hypothetical protein
MEQCPAGDKVVIRHPVVVWAETNDISWDIFTSLNTGLDPMLRYVKREIAVRDLAVIWN